MTADTYSATLGVLLMGTGNDNNTWGSNQNTSVFQILEDAIANSLSSSVTGGTLDLSTSPPPAGASLARYHGLIFTGTLGSAQSVKVPNLSKWWMVKNGTSGSFALTFKTPSGSASTSIPQNSGWQWVYCDGSDNIVVHPFNTIQQQMPDGTVALPAYSNVNETASGWYRAGTQDWRLSINGVAVLQVTGTGAGTPSVVNVLSPNALQVAGSAVLANGAVVKAADGTVSAPGLAFNSEAGSGLYRSSAGVVSFAILGVLRYTVTANDFTWIGASYAGTDVSPSAISADQNNYAPTNIATATCLRLNITAIASITGLTGGAAGRELELLNIGTATGKFPANSGSSSAANRFANTFNLFPGQSITLRYDATSSLWRPKNVATAYSSCAIAAVSPDLLIVNHTGTENTKIDVTASEAVLVDASGNAIKFENISVIGDSTTTGPNGCDSGTRAASTPYFIWLASDGVNIALVFSTSSVQATVLTNLTVSSAAYANYIYMKRVGWNITNGSSNFNRVRQIGNRAQYVVVAASATPNMPLMASGAAGPYTSSTVATFAAVLVTSYVPTTAIEILVAPTGKYLAGGNAIVMVAPNGNYNSWATANPPPWQNSNAAGGDITGSNIAAILLESTSIYWCSGGTGGGLFCVGWRDAI